MVRRERKQKR